jgi:hypothetical protein
MKLEKSDKDGEWWHESMQGLKLLEISMSSHRKLCIAETFALDHFHTEHTLRSSP